MKNKVRVAAAQIKTTDSILKNRGKILEFIEKAAKKKCDIVCFPEVATLHDGKKILKNRYKTKRIRELRDAISSIKDKCKNFGIWCIFGSYEPAGKNIYNTVYVVNRKGDIAYKYRKVHLWRREAKLVAPGKINKTVKTDFGCIGVIDCWDYAFPSFIQKLSKAGARIIFCPSFLVCSAGTEKLMESVPVVRAFENIAYYVMCDAFHKRTGSRSFISGPYKIMKRIENKEGMIHADLDLKFIDKMRKRFDTLD